MIGAEMQTDDLLIEIGTEELPPKALKSLAKAFEQGIVKGLDDAGIEIGHSRWLATPRRLAVQVSGVALAQPDRENERLGPNVSACFDDEGNPTGALKGFASSCGVEPDQLNRVHTDKGERMAFKRIELGQPTADLLPDIFLAAIKALPIPKRMRWGDLDVEFVRPVQWLVVLLGNEVVPLQALGVAADRVTYGHRFLSPEPVSLEYPDEYESALGESHVMADFQERRTRIQVQVQQAAIEAGGQALMDDALLDEVTALVEWPVAVSGQFDEDFLNLPREVLIAVMQDHQRYFPVESTDDALLPAFVTVANIDSLEPERVKVGNERVIRPRFADAMFFWEQDRKQPLEDFVEGLNRVTHQRDLGTIGERSGRIKEISRHIAENAGFDTGLVSRAANLAKADLLTQMVYEFTELQGTMGRYYAIAGGETQEVAAALEEQYLPRHAGDDLPVTPTGIALALADKLDLIAGIFSINKKPSGSRDPFALRRAAIGILRIMIEKELRLDLHDMTQKAVMLQPNLDASRTALTTTQVRDFIIDRLRSYLADDFPHDVIEAVIAVDTRRPADLLQRLVALENFLRDGEADSLCAAHKRAANILRGAEPTQIRDSIDETLLDDPAEKVLSALIESISLRVDDAIAEADYSAALTHMARLREPLDEFFDQVMVMDENLEIRGNRLAILSSLDQLFARVADLGLVNPEDRNGDEDAD